MARVREVLLLLAVAAAPALAGPVSIRINVSATVPPRPCEFPDPCGAAPNATAISSASIIDGRVLYVGPEPDVTRDGGLLTVRF